MAATAISTTLDSTRGLRPTVALFCALSGVSSSPGMYRELYSST